MFITHDTLYLSKDEISQLSLLLNTDDVNIKSLRHHPADLLEVIERLLKENERLDSPLKVIRAYFLPLWKERLSHYKK